MAAAGVASRAGREAQALCALCLSKQLGWLLPGNGNSGSSGGASREREVSKKTEKCGSAALC